jgi:hypothetical protein
VCEALPGATPGDAVLGAPDASAWTIATDAIACAPGTDDVSFVVDLGVSCGDVAGLTALALELHTRPQVTPPGNDVAVLLLSGSTVIGPPSADLPDAGGTTTFSLLAGASTVLAPDTATAVSLSRKGPGGTYALDAVTLRISGDLGTCTLDTDGDGLVNVEELALGTDWTNPDTDGDGVPDGDEVRDGTDPLNPPPAATTTTTTAMPPPGPLSPDPLPTTGGGSMLLAALGLLAVAGGAVSGRMARCTSSPTTRARGSAASR